MNSRLHQALLINVVSLLIVASPALAHHTIAAEFDTRDTVTLKGTLSGIDWVNPHIYFYLDVKNETGSVEHWSMESYPTGFFHRAGITRDLFKVGDEITVVLYRPKDGTKTLGYLKEMTLPSGRKIEFDNGRPPSR